MGRPRMTRPTDAELEILRHFWTRREATVREIRDEMVKTKRVAFTSIATLIRIMLEKDFLELVDARRPQKFRAIISQEQAWKSVFDDWLSRLFGGSVVDLIRHALTGRTCSKTEVAELKRIVGEAR